MERNQLGHPGLDGRMDLQKVGCGAMDWIELAYDRDFAGTCECGNEHSSTIK